MACCLTAPSHYLNQWWLLINETLWHSSVGNSTRPHFYQARSAWSMDQGSTKKQSAVHNFVPTVTKFCVMWEGQALPHDTKFGNCRGEIVHRRLIFIWSLIHGSSWSGLIKVGPEIPQPSNIKNDLKITYQTFHSNLPGAPGVNELNSSVSWNPSP